MKLLTPEQAASHPARSQLTRSLGSDLLLQIDIEKVAIEQGDVFVLCTDGLWDVVATTDLLALAAAIGTPGVPHPGVAAERLVATAIGRGTADNVTALVVQVTSNRPIPPAPAKRSFFARNRG
jgi:protein phosphatase